MKANFRKIMKNALMEKGADGLCCVEDGCGLDDLGRGCDGDRFDFKRCVPARRVERDGEVVFEAMDEIPEQKGGGS